MEKRCATRNLTQTHVKLRAGKVQACFGRAWPPYGIRVADALVPAAQNSPGCDGEFGTSPARPRSAAWTRSARRIARHSTGAGAGGHPGTSTLKRLVGGAVNVLTIGAPASRRNVTVKSRPCRPGSPAGCRSDSRRRRRPRGLRRAPSVVPVAVTPKLLCASYHRRRIRPVLRALDDDRHRRRRPASRRRRWPARDPRSRC